MSWFYRIKRHFLIKVLGALGFGSVVGFCIVSCDAKPASQADQKVSTVETTDTTAPSPDARPNEPQPADTVANAENTANADTTKPEESANDAPKANADEAQPVNDAGTAAQDDTPNQPSAETSAQDLNQQSDNRDVDKVTVVTKKTPGAIKVSYSPKNASLMVDSKIICVKSPCYIKMNDPYDAVEATIEADGYDLSTVRITKEKSKFDFKLAKTEDYTPQNTKDDKREAERLPVVLYLL